jgi:CBS domain-containing protein
MLIRTVAQAVEGRPVVAIAPTASVYSAVELLQRENIGALAVSDPTGLAGVVSERDVVRRCVFARCDIDEMAVSEIMTPDPQTVGRDTSLVIAMDLMMRGGFRHLPVVDDGIVYGMLSMRQIPAQYRMLYERYEAAFTELDELAAMGVQRYRSAPGN